MNDTAAWARLRSRCRWLVSECLLEHCLLFLLFLRFFCEEGVGLEQQRNRDEEARLDSARQALSVLMGRQEAARPVVQREPMLPEMVGV